MKTVHAPLLVLTVAMVATSCGSLRPTSQVADDVYFRPSQAPTPTVVEAPMQQPSSVPPSEDYYDPGTSQTVGANSNYYDLTYNDPYYYNMGRFGFNTPMGWQSGWNGPGWGGGINMGWGGGMGWGNSWDMRVGYGTGVFSGWYSPSWNVHPWGYDPWGWSSPWFWGRPWYAWNNGFGHGHYYSPWGNCYGGYVPVIIGDGSSNRVVVQHRNSMGSRSGIAADGGVRRSPARNPVGLSPTPERRGTILSPQDRNRRSTTTNPGTTTTPTRDRGTSIQRDRSTRDGAPTRGGERTAPSRSPSVGDGGGRSSPSRGGGNSGGGGGTRTSPGRR